MFLESASDGDTEPTRERSCSASSSPRSWRGRSTRRRHRSHRRTTVLLRPTANRCPARRSSAAARRPRTDADGRGSGGGAGAPRQPTRRQRLPHQRIPRLMWQQLRRPPVAGSAPRGRRLLRPGRRAARRRRVGLHPLRDGRRCVQLRGRGRHLRQPRQRSRRVGLRLLLRTPRQHRRRHGSARAEGPADRHRRQDGQRRVLDGPPALRGEVRRERRAVRSVPGDGDVGPHDASSAAMAVHHGAGRRFLVLRRQPSGRLRPGVSRARPPEDGTLR